jgi:hypothetical protein
LPRANPLAERQFERNDPYGRLDKGSKPAPTLILMTVALQVDPRNSGAPDAHFVYVSATPLPNGKWYWSRDSIGQLAPASPNILSAYPALSPPAALAGGPTLGVVTTSGTAGRSGGGHGRQAVAHPGAMMGALPRRAAGISSSAV